MEIGTYHAFVADFGLARAISATRAIETHTMLSGTTGFQAPEQLKQENIDARCDVYAFGGVRLSCSVVDHYGQHSHTAK